MHHICDINPRTTSTDVVGNDLMISSPHPLSPSILLFTGRPALPIISGHDCREALLRPEEAKSDDESYSYSD